MKKIKLYTKTLIGVSIVVLFVSYFSSNHLYEVAKKEIWDSKIEASQRESRVIALLLEQQLKSGISKLEVISNLQASIENTDFKSDFICMYNKQGLEICHPNPSLIGRSIQNDSLDLVLINDNSSSSFKSILNKGQKSSGVRSVNNDFVQKSEIVSVYPVANTDWMVASHANVKALEEQFSTLYIQFLLNLILSTLVISVCAFLMVRLIYKKFENDMISDNLNLNKQLSDLQLLNVQLNKNQEKLDNNTSIANHDEAELAKKRIVTYHKDELIMLDVMDVAYVFLDNSITYFVSFDGKQYSSTHSLDEVIKGLSTDYFFRANRQFIINIRSIVNILIYGKNQLKLKINPATKIEVLISKNKVAEFKQWIDQ